MADQIEEQIDSDVNIPELLATEQEELNTWVRTSLTIYFTWYSGFLTVNAAGLAWLAKGYTVGLGPVFGMFAFFNVLGIVASIAVHRYIRESSDRSNAIYKFLLKEAKPAIRPQSAMPKKIAQFVMILHIAAMTSLAMGWAYLGWPKPTTPSVSPPASLSQPAHKPPQS